MSKDVDRISRDRKHRLDANLEQTIDAMQTKTMRLVDLKLMRPSALFVVSFARSLHDATP
jgi:hypothetical protein